MKRLLVVFYLILFVASAAGQGGAKSEGSCSPIDLGRTAELLGAFHSTGSPVSGAKLSAEPANGKRPPVLTTLTEDGHFRFLRLPAGKYLLLLHRKGLPDNRYYVELQPGAKHRPLEITLPIAGAC